MEVMKNTNFTGLFEGSDHLPSLLTPNEKIRYPDYPFPVQQNVLLLDFMGRAVKKSMPGILIKMMIKMIRRLSCLLERRVKTAM